LSDIRHVQNWGTSVIGHKVPSVITYSATQGNSWGYGIGDNAYVLRWTKLELEPPSRLTALTLLRQTLSEARQLSFNRQNVLARRIPRHLIKTSVDIMTDYLTEVAICVRHDIENNRDKTTLTQFPIDLVITHPAVWDARAKNLTFRAVTTAFERIFPEVASTPSPSYTRLATESEACAQYTMRDAQNGQVNTLRKGECFVVVDAGGGTVVSAKFADEIVAMKQLKGTRTWHPIV
jgi:hypothetical protein